MSEKQVDFLKEKGISISTLAILIGFIVYQAKFQQRTESGLHEFEKHRTEFVEFKNEIKQTYIPRSENQIDKENIYSILREIKGDVKSLINKRN